MHVDDTQDLAGLLGWFSLESRKVIDFASPRLHDCLKKARATFSSNQK